MIKVVVNRDAVAEILKSQRVADDLIRRAENIAAQAGKSVKGPRSGMLVEYYVGKSRGRASVMTDTIDAMVAEAHDRVLSRAIDAGRA